MSGRCRPAQDVLVADRRHRLEPEWYRSGADHVRSGLGRDHEDDDFLREVFAGTAAFAVGQSEFAFVVVDDLPDDGQTEARAFGMARAFGVDAAAYYYFNKSARDVNLAEAAMLAGLFKAPSRFAPHINLPAARARAETQSVEHVREAARLAQELLIGQGAGLPRLPFPDERRLVPPGTRDVPIEAVDRRVQLAADEPPGERRLPVEHPIPGTRPFELVGKAGPERFRIALGGAREHFGLVPDMITTAKGIAGGMVLSTLLAYTAVYAALLLAYVGVIFHLARKGGRYDAPVASPGMQPAE